MRQRPTGFRWTVLGLVVLSTTVALAADVPLKLTALTPAAGATLSGTVEVQVKAEGTKLPSRVWACFGGPPWTELVRVGEQAEWHGTLDSTLSPNGPATLWVSEGTGRNGLWARVKLTLDNPWRCFFGDLHDHTMYSDGSQTPAAAVQYAREVAKLDFFALTDHNLIVDGAEWADTREVLWQATQAGSFVALAGLEWTTPWGHACLYDPPGLTWPLGIEELYTALAATRTLAKFNHPVDPAGAFEDFAYSEEGDRSFRLMEVRSPGEQDKWVQALNLGWHLAPDGSTDCHGENWGNTGTWTGVLAPGLSRATLLDALWQRRTFSTRDRNCRVLFRVNGAVMGSILEKPCAAVTVTAEAEDPDTAEKIAKAELFEDGKVVVTETPGANPWRWEKPLTPARGKHYYFLKLTQADGNVLWTAPVWLTVAGP